MLARLMTGQHQGRVPTLGAQPRHARLRPALLLNLESLRKMCQIPWYVSPLPPPLSLDKWFSIGFYFKPYLSRYLSIDILEPRFTFIIDI